MREANACVCTSLPSLRCFVPTKTITATISLSFMSLHRPPEPDASKSLVQTRVPHPMRTYLKAYAKHHGLKMEGLLAEVLSHFMHLRPDQQGMTWRTPQSHRSEAGAASGWAQINVLIDDEVAGRFAGLAMELNISRATLAYTALYWFVRYMRPPLGPASSSSTAPGARNV